MTTVLTKPQRGGWIANFYLSRFLRIFPLYWLILGLTIAFGLTGVISIGAGFGTVGSPVANIQSQWAAAGLLARFVIIASNITTVAQDVLRQIVYVPAPGTFSSIAPPGSLPGLTFNIVGQAWSLGPEVVFYAAAPFLVRQGPTLIVAMIIVIVLRYTDLGIYVRYFPPFIAGALLAHIVARGNALYLRLGMITALLFGLDAMMAVAPPGGGIAAVALVLAIPFLAVMRSRIDTFLGEMSYPLYISHFLIFQACLTFEDREIVTATAMLAVAVILTICVDRPVRRFRKSLETASL